MDKQVRSKIDAFDHLKPEFELKKKIRFSLCYNVILDVISLLRFKFR